MTRIPVMPLILGLAGLLPFLYGAAEVVFGFAQDPAPDGEVILQGYGFAIFCFMSGVLWGFAARADGATAARGYVASVLPVLAVLALVFFAIATVLEALFLGFLVLLAFDSGFARAGMTPAWWMALRILLTAIVTICMSIGLIYA